MAPDNLHVETETTTARAPGLIVRDLAVLAVAAAIAWVSIFGAPGTTPAVVTEWIEDHSR